ncbi:hypothetical protein RF11_10487 [Thelohanellus kitauei]|uniref:Uncharacterized protein n=1 Tax=Thelohanellus kitauei TaxID=669202 RepID=A0A0C2IXB1_THEKT|nr:hypothetical protein RF11_10487 [Thelohanellus kitauei]
MVVVKDSRIKGFTFDPSMNYIFYFTRKEIFILDIKTMLRRKIFYYEGYIMNVQISDDFTSVLIICRNLFVSCYTFNRREKLEYKLVLGVGGHIHKRDSADTKKKSTKSF